MIAWLDTETKAILRPSPPEKIAPPITATFALVLLAIRGDASRLCQAVERIRGRSREDARRVVAHSLPVVVQRGLAQEDALLGQFELICCDDVSVFVADEVVAGASAGYMADLYATLLNSVEFATVDVRLESVPAGESGQQFIERFLGPVSLQLPAELTMMRKKARIMEHWARKIGGRLAVSSSEGRA
jgi:hypothetical protein